MDKDFNKVREGRLDVGDGHTLYWREHGNPAAPVVAILHGGPGGMHNPRMASFFDAAQWRIVLFDQRGCGNSTPFASTEHNTTAKLVADMERLREALGVRQWLLFGGSWGTRLALDYGLAHPERCSGFMMRGVFLGRAQDTQWYLWDARQLYPDAHAALLDSIEAIGGQRPQDLHELLALTAPLFAPGHPERQRLATAWDSYESAMSAVRALPPLAEDGEAGVQARALSLSLATLEHHYLMRVLPQAPDPLPLIHRIAHLPCEIVQGRYDSVCPLAQAWALHQAWPGSQLRVAPTSGHWPFEPEMAALLEAASARPAGPHGHALVMMKHFDATATAQALAFGPLIAAIRQMFVAGCEVPLRHSHQIGENISILIMPAWQGGRYLGVKTVSIAPGNAALGLPGLFSSYQLFNAATGVPLAQIDGNEITSRRTAAASALAASCLARPDAKRLLVVGAGRVGSLLPEACRALLPIEHVQVWDIRPEAAIALAERLNAQGFQAQAVPHLQAACAQADIVSCATLSQAPLVHGEWLQPGSHLDLIGSFRPDMREAADSCFAGARLWIDTGEAMLKSGDLLGPLKTGVISEASPCGTLADLCRRPRAPHDGKTRTVFKAVGTALEDLAAAILVYEHPSNPRLKPTEATEP